MVSLPTPICVTRPQWVKQRMATKCIVYYTNVWSTEIAVIDFPAGSSTILQSLVRCVCHQTWYTCLSTELGVPPHLYNKPYQFIVNYIAYHFIQHIISPRVLCKDITTVNIRITYKEWLITIHIFDIPQDHMWLILICSLSLIVGLSNICI